MKRTISTALAGGLIGGAAVWALQAGSIRLSPAGMAYADLAAVMLGAVAALLAILGVFIAVIAIWGYAQFRVFVESAATKQVSEALREGELKTLFEERATVFMSQEFETGRLRRMLEDRVDQIILRGPQERNRKERGAESPAEEDDVDL